jgi:hypothetical protein
MDENLIEEFIAKINENPIKPCSIGVVYGLIGDEIYIGKTSTSLSTRARGHKYSFIQFRKDPSKRWCNSTFVMEKNKVCKMVILKMIPIYSDEDEKELVEKEQEFIMQFECVNRYEEKEEEKEKEEITEEECGVIIDIPIQIGIIYKIYDELGMYIGSTIGPLSYRMDVHIRSALIYSTEKSMGICSSHEIILRDRYRVEVVEFVMVKSKDDLRMKEREWIEKTDCVNKKIPIRSAEESRAYHKDYYNIHKNEADFIATCKRYKDKYEEKIKQYQLEYRAEHAEEFRNYFKNRHQEQKLNPIYLKKRKEQKKKWNQSEKGKQSNNEYNNRPEVKERRRLLYQQKKEKETEEDKEHRKKVQKERNQQQVECCGKVMTRKSLTAHKKTKKHIENFRI